LLNEPARTLNVLESDKHFRAVKPAFPVAPVTRTVFFETEAPVAMVFAIVDAAVEMEDAGAGAVAVVVVVVAIDISDSFTDSFVKTIWFRDDEERSQRETQ
jgi:hypothetical protein